jgi:hypothetical protein
MTPSRLALTLTLPLSSALPTDTNTGTDTETDAFFIVPECVVQEPEEAVDQEEECRKRQGDKYPLVFIVE